MGRLIVITLVTLTFLFALLFLGCVAMLFNAPEPGDGYFTLAAGINLALCGIALSWWHSKKQAATRMKIPAQLGVVALMLIMAYCGCMAGILLALHPGDPENDYHVIAMLFWFIYLNCGAVVWLVGRRWSKTPKKAMSNVF